MNDRRWLAPALLMLAAAGATATLLLTEPLAQPVAYHDFADQRQMLGVPHALNVLSNFAFLLVGAVGLRQLATSRRRRRFLSERDSRPYVAFFLAVIGIGFGSGYYHLDPDNESLFWDRLPMAISFAALFAALVNEHLGPRWGRPALPVLIVLAVAATLYWILTERAGAGDLRPYLLVQGIPLLLAVPLVLLLRSRYQQGRYFLAAVGIYGLALILDRHDHTIYRVLDGAISGHTLKHLAGALAACVIVRMLARR